MALGYAWTLTRDDIIKSALRKIGVLGIGETPETEMLTNGALALNGVLKEWSGIHSAPWRTNTLAIATTANQSYVTLGGTTYTIAILSATIATVSNRSDAVPIEIIDASSMQERLIDTTDSGKPTQGAIYYGGTYITQLNLNPIPDKIYYMDLELLRLFQDFGAGSDTMQMSSAWGNALIYATAAELSHEYSCPMNERQAMRAEAERTLRNAKLSTVERPTSPVRAGYY